VGARGALTARRNGGYIDTGIHPPHTAVSHPHSPPPQVPPFVVLSRL
jgi:hypothetical protein